MPPDLFRVILKRLFSSSLALILASQSAPAWPLSMANAPSRINCVRPGAHDYRRFPTAAILVAYPFGTPHGLFHAARSATAFAVIYGRNEIWWRKGMPPE